MRSLANAVMGKVPGKPGRLDTATRMAMDAGFSAEPHWPAPADARDIDGEAPKVDPIEELRRIVEGSPERDKGADRA